MPIAASSTNLDIGPREVRMASYPAIQYEAKPNPFKGVLPLVGLNPTTPFKLAGILIDPPISVPNPNGEQRVAKRTASPPDDPPEYLDLSQAFFVLPKILLVQSVAMFN